MKKNNLAFSFVELLIAISIISILSLVAYNGYTSFLDSSNNAKIREDLDSLSLALKNYIKAENKLPDPKGNKNYFDSDSSYVHGASGAYGVYGQATKTLLDSKYIDFVPKDPRLGVYYSYGKVLDKPEFELAGVLRKDSEYMSLVKSHYSSEIGPVNLIRAYDGPEFVYNGSKLEFPYNPEQKILTAKIRKLSGNLTITQADGTNYNISNVSEAEKIDLLEGTKLKLSGANSKIEIYFSDGSISVLEGNGAKMTLDNMKYKQENSLFTSIKLFLESGKLRTKATKLSQNSSFEVGTPDAMTAVRGTIFGVERDGSTIVKLIKGKIEVTKTGATSQTLSGALKQTEATASIIETPIDFDLTTQEEKTLNEFGKITKNNRVELVSYSRYGENFEIKLKDLKLANYIKIWTGAIEPEPDEPSLYHENTFIKGNLIVLNDKNFQENSLSWGKNAPDLNIRLCRTNNNTECTEPPLIIKNIDKVDYGVEGSNMKTSEEFFKNTLGDWVIGTGASVISSSEFHKFAYAPYNQIGDLDLYDEDGNLVASAAGTGILNGETIDKNPKFFEVCDMDSSFALKSLCQIGGVKGIWIDNVYEDDNLYYTGSTNSGLNLNSGSGFVIEMSVRGEDLMEDYATAHYLFDSNNYNLYLYSKKGILYLNDKDFGKINGLEKNKFYRIIVGVKNNKMFLIIPALNYKKIEEYNGRNINKLYIGAKYNSKEQWNSIIDYVKIYK